MSEKPKAGNANDEGKVDWRTVRLKESNRGYASNYIKTSKYTVLTFLPKNLFEQLHRIANLYFISIIVLNFIPQLTVFAPATSIFPVAFVLGVTAIKDMFEDRRRHVSDHKLNNMECEGSQNDKPYEKITWAHIHVGNVLRLRDGEQVPADCVCMRTSDKNGICWLETAHLDGENTLKLRSALGSAGPEQPDATQCAGVIECEQPNAQLFEFNGRYIKESSETVNIEAENLLLRGSVIRNTEWIEGVVVYTGHDTKSMQNCRSARPKRSQLERDMNREVIALVVILFLMCLTSAIGTTVYLNNLNNWQNVIYLQYDSSDSVVSLSIIAFFSLIIVYQVVIPIALYVSLEIIKLALSASISNDVTIYHPDNDMPAQCHALNICEDLGQVQTILSDKTGTLTQNKMVFRCCSVFGKVYHTPDDSEVQASDRSVVNGVVLGAPLSEELITDAENGDEKIREFATLMAVCNTCMPQEREAEESQASLAKLAANGYSEKYMYQSQSPDEACLVLGAGILGSTLTARNQQSCTVTCGDEEIELVYQVIAILPFDSTRKRMSILVKREDDGTTWLYTKGSDETIIPIIEPGENNLAEVTANHVTEFAQRGLRTLCFCRKEMSAEAMTEFYTKWDEINESAKTSTQRKKMIAKLSKEIEVAMELIGCTGIEDKLQEGVPETILKLREAGINVWVITGDQRDTALSICRASNLFSSDMQLCFLDAWEEDKCARQLANAEEALKTSENQTVAIAVAGRALVPLLEHHATPFAQLALKSKAVVIYRATPDQKAQVCEAVMKNTERIVLSIGDGNNDVAMIRAASIGVGISGEEGSQAVLASDFSIAQFRFLQTLLLVHGHWSYYRLATIVIYFYYKNLIFTLILYWFMFDCGFSGQTTIDQWQLVFFSSLYTSIPPIVVPIYEQDLPRELLLAEPVLYNLGRLSTKYNMKLFWIMVLDSIYQSGVLYVFSKYAYGSDDGEGTLWTVGVSTMAALVFVVNLHLAMDIKAWVWPICVAFGVSFLLYFVVTLILSSLETTEQYWVFIHSLGTGRFWFILLISVVGALMPRFTILMYNTLFNPSEIEVLRRQFLLRCRAVGDSRFTQTLDHPLPVRYTVTMDKSIAIDKSNDKPIHMETINTLETPVWN